MTGPASETSERPGTPPTSSLGCPARRLEHFTPPETVGLHPWCATPVRILVFAPERTTYVPETGRASEKTYKEGEGVPPCVCHLGDLLVLIEDIEGTKKDPELADKKEEGGATLASTLVSVWFTGLLVADLRIRLLGGAVCATTGNVGTEPDSGHFRNDCLFFFCCTYV
ncbi:hypothetical protein PUN28_010439 [Cardiocondyla obscurior]|uniref:Uncharacterized protein n=1 Tax=Cardiocondyla obscurior TaxID=286306 RepID=A0AAW2FHI9_9HYME